MTRRDTSTGSHLPERWGYHNGALTACHDEPPGILHSDRGCAGRGYLPGEVAPADQRSRGHALRFSVASVQSSENLSRTCRRRDLVCHRRGLVEAGVSARKWRARRCELGRAGLGQSACRILSVARVERALGAVCARPWWCICCPLRRCGTAGVRKRAWRRRAPRSADTGCQPAARLWVRVPQSAQRECQRPLRVRRMPMRPRLW